jgi:hypothetical protein
VIKQQRKLIWREEYRLLDASRRSASPTCDRGLVDRGELVARQARPAVGALVSRSRLGSGELRRPVCRRGRAVSIPSRRRPGTLGTCRLGHPGITTGSSGAVECIGSLRLRGSLNTPGI